MLTITLQGGLGNVLFQLAAARSISRKNGRRLCLPSLPKTHHSEEDYYSNILQNWKLFQEPLEDTIQIQEPSYQFQDWQFANVDKNIHLLGYFQNYKYIDDDFIDTLVLPEMPVLEGAFLHIRGGDYVNHWLHDVKLNNYYYRAIEKFPKGTKFYIMTNDIPYAKTMSFLNSIDYEFVEEPNEVRCLSLMKNTTLGGICANSTFSWWGGYLNRENRTIVLPSKWFNMATYVEGYFFPGSLVQNV